MATLLEAVRRGVLHLYALPEFEGRSPVRELHLTDSVFDWIEHNETALHAVNWSTKNGGRSRYEHMELAFCDFRCQPRPLVGELNRVQPTSKGVFKLHCPGLRFYGWAPNGSDLVLVTAAFSEDVHGEGSQTKERVASVLDFAKKHELEQTIQREDRSALFKANT